MKKAWKRSVITLLAIALSVALTMPAFALVWRSSGEFSGPGYSGNYSLFVDTTPELSKVKFSVWDYTGLLVIDGGVSVTVTTYYTDEHGEQKVDTRSYPALFSDSHTWEIITPVPSDQVTSMYFNFTYMAQPVASHTFNFS